jgi:ATP-dependent DNA helicase RecQ
MKIEYFIEQIEDENNRQVAYKQLRELVSYCESNVCRRKLLLAYFGEKFDESNCGSCDVCLEPKERFDGTIAAQKILSCVYRVGERFGMNYVVDVLLGSKNQKVLQNRHDTIKTYGIGKEYSKSQWQAFARELIQLGYLKLDGDKYPVLKLNEKSKDVLLRNEKVSLTKPEEAPHIFKAEAGEDYDRTLFEQLRVLRKTMADREGVPPYVIFHDTSLKEMSTQYPQSVSELLMISGMGERKLRRYGDAFLHEIVNYCKLHNIEPKPRILKRPASLIKQQKTSTVQETLDLYKQRLTMHEIAKKRGLALSTISSHLEKLILDGEDISVDSLVDPEKQQRIAQTLKELGMQALSPVKEKLGDGYSYEEIRLVRAKMMRDGEKN